MTFPPDLLGENIFIRNERFSPMGLWDGDQFALDDIAEKTKNLWVVGQAKILVAQRRHMDTAFKPLVLSRVSFFYLTLLDTQTKRDEIS